MDQLNTPSPLRASFYKDPDGKRDLVEIRVVGDPNTIVQKVTPDHISQFPREWEAYQARLHRDEEPEVYGTSLLEIPGVDRVAAARLKMFDVRSVEELAALDEAAVKRLGLGGLTFWKSAKMLLKAKQAEKLEALMAKHDEPEPVAAPAPRRGRPPKTTEDAA